MSALPPRDYQDEAIAAVESAWGRGVRRPAVVMATGLGKTVIFAHVARRWLERREGPGGRALVLAHRTELIDQAARKLRSIAPDSRIGTVQADRNETLNDVVVASVQTLASERRRAMLRGVGLIVVDEAHHATAPTYKTIMQHYGAYATGGATGRDGAVAVGFTATMARGDGGALGSVWQDVVFTRDYAYGVAHGWLVRPRCVHVRVDDLDLGAVRKSRGDYSASDLGHAIEDSMAPEAIVKAMREHAPDRPTILFAPLVSTAELIRDALIAEGFTAAVVSAKTPDDERRRIIAAYERREIQVLCNAMVFTEGTDLPLTSCIVIARPTKSKSLFIQMVGRGGRPDVGKSDLVVIDVTGASRLHSLALPVELFGEGENERPDRDPCTCGPWQEVCPCGSVCTRGCLCGGGRTCGCPRADVVDEDVELGDVLDDPSWANGPLVAEEIDLFHGSDSAWMRTEAGGVWFLAAGERYIAIVPGQRSGLDVVWLHRERRGEWGYVVQDVQDRGYAMAWAEGAVTPAETLTARKERAWRAKRPTPAQIGYARKFGIVVADGMLSGEVSARITVAQATRRIDPGLAPWMLRG